MSTQDSRVQRGQHANEPGRRKGLLEDLSVSQVLAGALAAVTSVALSSKIGIAGSLIGVAVASVVSTVASQLYRGMLRRANDKIRELASRESAPGEACDSDPYGLASRDASASPQPDAPLAARIAPAQLREAAHQRRAREIHRRVMVAAIVSSLLAVAVSAGVVLLITNGEGLGQRTVYVATTQEAATTAAATHHAVTSGQTASTTSQAPDAGAETESASSSSGGSGQQGGVGNAETDSAGTGGTEQPGATDAPAEPETSEATE